jgi:hypothetical protein
MAVIRITERFVRNRARVAEGLAGLEDRSSRPHRLRQPTPREVIEKIERLELEPVRRYVRENPGELKKLSRIGSVGHRITGRQTLPLSV